MLTKWHVVEGTPRESIGSFHGILEVKAVTGRGQGPSSSFRVVSPMIELSLMRTYIGKFQHVAMVP